MQLITGNNGSEVGMLRCRQYRVTTPPTSRDKRLFHRRRTQAACCKKIIISGRERLHMRVWNAQWRMAGRAAGGSFVSIDRHEFIFHGSSLIRHRSSTNQSATFPATMHHGTDRPTSLIVSVTLSSSLWLAPRTKQLVTRHSVPCHSVTSPRHKAAGKNTLYCWHPH